jgi:hypothetical protein
VQATLPEAGEMVAQQGIGSERQVRAVLFGRAERDHDRVTTAVELRSDLRPGQPIELDSAHSAPSL